MTILFFTSSSCLNCLRWFTLYERLNIPLGKDDTFIPIDVDEEDKDTHDFCDLYDVGLLPHVIILENDMQKQVFNKAGYFDPKQLKKFFEKEQ